MENFKAKVNKWSHKAFCSKNANDKDAQLVFKAISEGKLRLARILIEGKVNVNCQDSDGRTPLIAVCRSNYNIIDEESILHFVQFLIKEEAIINSTDVFCMQALDYATKNGFHQVKEVILGTLLDVLENFSF
ncbi:ankyrin repeat domain-containing protein 34A-like [Mytilus trossulus]|uniref:ankyrin repeat domain-containing protein 34A-like n=1 Tax=Mytilus trossulus TaxID=6551 RepID=UPI003005F0DE